MANEKRLIDVNELIEEINDAISNIAFTSPYQNDIATMVSGMERVLDIVEDASAVDAVEVVRCKDCTHWKHMFDFIGDCSCPRYHIFGHANPSMGANDFCSCGERRTE